MLFRSYSFTASDIGADTFSLFSVSGGSFGTISNFTVNSNTGAGSFKVTFGTGASTVISLKLQDDDGGVSNQLTLTATIQLLNNAPTNISLSPASVSENVASGTVVGTLSSTDPDGIVIKRRPQKAANLGKDKKSSDFVLKYSHDEKTY